MFRIVLLVISFMFFGSFARAQGQKCSETYSLLTLDTKTNKVLYQEKADKIQYPASLTKLMTLYIAFDDIKNGKISMDTKIVKTSRSISQPSSKLGISKVTDMTVREAITGIVVKSFNDVSVSLAETIAGNEWDFVHMMNKKAAELGMYNTNFRNASGLHDEEQFTTAFDMAILAMAIKRDFPEFFKIFSTREFVFHGKKYATHNHVLVDYNGAKGMKTGFTNASGFNLIANAERNNNDVMLIIMGCSTYRSRDKFSMAMLDDSFSKLDSFSKPASEKHLVSKR